MKMCRLHSAVLQGLSPTPIEIEVASYRGQPNFIIIGLAQKTLEESKQRITSAIINCGFRMKAKKTVVNLAPVDIKKTSSLLELPIAIGLLINFGYIQVNLNDSVFFGELSLDGEIRAVKGLLPLIIAAKKLGYKNVFFPADNMEEIKVISHINLFPLRSLQQFLSLIKQDHSIDCSKARCTQSTNKQTNNNSQGLFAQIAGQQKAKRALLISAAGRHHLMYMGPPGSGKTMLAKSLISLLPDLTVNEAIDVTSLYSLRGLHSNQLITTRPFRSPHHSISYAALLGGGKQLLPGEISLAHNGVLFLDEFCEFRRNVLEAIREPIESKQIIVNRVHGCVKYPADFTLVAACNPCPCGYAYSDNHICRCSYDQINNYQKKISGPLLDRIDIFFKVEPVNVKIIRKHKPNYDQEIQLKQKIKQCHAVQKKRFHSTSINFNSQMNNQVCKQYCKLNIQTERFLLKADEKLNLSARSYYKILRLARTIADVEQSMEIEVEHLAEALSYQFKPAK